MGGNWPKKLSSKDGFKKSIFGIKHELARLCLVLYTPSFGNFWEKVEHFGIFFWKFWKYLEFLDILDFFFENYELIYPSQRQNLLPTLEILNQNFQNFHNFQNFGKKFQNLDFFSKISKTTKGPPPPD